MNPFQGGKGLSRDAKKSPLKVFLINIRKRRIIETLAAFIGGGWLIIEFVDWILVAHYHFPEKTIDITFVTLLGALLCTLIWRWFSGRDKPRKFKLEAVLIPLVLLITILLDINLMLHLKPAESETFSTSIWKNSIAVLPFVDMSPQKDQEYFCDGISEDLINRLSNVKELKVPARTSAFMFKGKTPDMHDIGEKLKVQTVLEGSIQKSGNQLRITAQLINIADGYHLWSEKYDREMKDVFAIQDEISSAIVNALKLRLTPEEKTKISRRPIDNVQVYELHLRARYEMLLVTEEGLGRALQLIENGLEILGDNEILYADMGQAYILYSDFGIKKEESLINKAEEYIKKVFALNPDSSYGHYLKGRILRGRGNAQAAVIEFKRSLAIDPNNPDAMMWLCWVYAYSGRGLAARHLVSQLLEIDPLYPLNQAMAGILEVMDGKFDTALKALNKARELERENPLLRYWYAKDLAYAQHYKEALELFDLIRKDTPWVELSAFSKFALQKKKSEALQTLTEESKKLMREDELFTIWMAESYALINEKDEAIDWIENGVKWGFINYPFLTEYDPFLANIRGEPRFKKLMERVKYEREHFEI